MQESGRERCTIAFKGGKLNLNTVTSEIIDSSKAVLQNYRGRGTKGLQQFFSPKEAAQLVFKVFGRVATLDLTAGNGALFNAFPEELRFGVEIDPDLSACNAQAKPKTLTIML